MDHKPILDLDERIDASERRILRARTSSCAHLKTTYLLLSLILLLFFSGLSFARFPSWLSREYRGQSEESCSERLSSIFDMIADIPKCSTTFERNFLCGSNRGCGWAWQRKGRKLFWLNLYRWNGMSECLTTRMEWIGFFANIDSRKEIVERRGFHQQLVWGLRVELYLRVELRVEWSVC